MDITTSGKTVNVARHLPAMAASAPDREALLVPRGRGQSGIDYQRLTFAELDAEVDARRRRLTEAGVTRGTRVLLLVKPGLELIAMVFALFKAGAVPVLIDPGMGLRGFLRCVRHTRPEAMVAIPAGIWLARVFRGDFRSVRVRLRADEREARQPGAEPLPLEPTGPRDPAAVLFTSGSTGPAKGVCYEHGMFEAQVRLIRSQYGIEPGEIDLPMLPVFALFNPALGMTTVVPEINPSRPASVDPAKIVQAIRQCGVTNSFGSPVLWKKIGRHCRERGIRLPSLRRILMAGTAAPPSVLRDYRHILDGGEIHTPYGATEALPVCSISGTEILGETAVLTEEGRGTCVGRPVPEIEARVLPVAAGPLSAPTPALPTGEIGEIAVRGPVVTRAYDGLPEATAAAKIPDGDDVWHRMGDLGYFDEAGRLWFCGRLAERVEAGEKIHYTDCCEAVFNTHPHVFRTALIGWESPAGRVPALAVEPEPGMFPRGQAARRALAGELAALGANHPHTREITRFFFVKHFPVDVRHNAKIHRRTLARRCARRRPVEAE